VHVLSAKSYFDPELDADMLSRTSTMQKKDYWKANLFAECQAAYTEAMDEMESGDLILI
jgi:hypothetical protein